MKKKNIFQLFLSGVICLLCTTSCSVEPDFYSQVVPETFYSSQDAVWQRFNRPFTHWRWYIAHDSPRWLLQELGTDEFCLPTRGSDWYDGAVYQKFHHHLRLSTAFLQSGIILPSFPDNRSPPEVPFYFPSYPLQETSSLPACG